MANPLAFINVYSDQEAKQLIQTHPDTAHILLDVVMESDNAGLEVVKCIRERLKNHFVRIVLRTGQPGQAPEEKVIVNYDINDYKALLDYKSGKLTLSGQHEQLMIVRRDGQAEMLDTLDASVETNTNLANFIGKASVQLQPGDGVVLYTHGIIQAKNEAGEEFGLHRLRDAVSRHWPQPAEAIKQAVIEDVHRHIGQQNVQDDLTLVIVKQK